MKSIRFLRVLSTKSFNTSKTVLTRTGKNAFNLCHFVMISKMIALMTSYEHTVK